MPFYLHASGTPVGEDHAGIVAAIEADFRALVNKHAAHIGAASISTHPPAPEPEVTTVDLTPKV